jgi:chromosome segregation ATPase
MLGMTTHNENITRVQQGLWYLINDEDVRTILRYIIGKMNEVGDSSERLKQLYDEVQAYIPDDNKYDKKYWVAAYILHLTPSLKEIIENLASITQEIEALKNELMELEEEIEETEYEVEDLQSTLEDMEYELSCMYYDMRHGCEDCEYESDPEELEIEIEELNNALGAMESDLGYLYYKRRTMGGQLAQLECKREELLGSIKEIAEQIVVS